MVLEMRPMYVQPSFMGFLKKPVFVTVLIANIILLGPTSRAPIYSDSSMKNMNNHLSAYHGVTKDHFQGGQEQSVIASESRIVAAFGRTISPGLQFNSKIFKLMFIRWIYVTNTPFYAIEVSTF